MSTSTLQPPITLIEAIPDASPQIMYQFDMYMNLLYRKINELEERIAVLEGGS